MKVDLHTHTTASDGSLSPKDLLASAIENEIALLAITDHDTVAGVRSLLLDSSGHDLESTGIKVLAGVEISTQWKGSDIHIVGLNIDLENEELNGSLRNQAALRLRRAKQIALKLEKYGMEKVYERVLEIAGGENIGRPHFAQYLIEQNKVKDFKQAFSQYLAQGKKAYVKTEWPDIADAISWIKAAGGLAVLAHPARYKLTASKTRVLVGYFAENGGSALEFNGPSSKSEKDKLLLALCDQHKLAVSLGSDFHHKESKWQRLGFTIPLPDNYQGVWELFCES